MAHPFQPAGFFAFRTPLLPFELLTRLGTTLAALAASTPQELQHALGQDRDLLREAYRALLDAPVIREAIFVASPDFDQALDHWRRDADSDRGQTVERALTRYLTRLASRATPFGLFASTAVGALGATTALLVAPRTDCRRHTRLDMDYLVRLVDALERDATVAASLHYTPNSSLHRSADRLQYVETRLRGTGRSHHLVALAPSQPLDSAIERARSGATRRELVAALVDEAITLDEARAFVEELVESQVLVSDLPCPVTGPEPLDALVERLHATPGADAAANVLVSVSSAIGALDEEPLGASTDRYRAIARQLEALPAGVDLARLFQVDLTRPPTSTLGADVVSEIARGVALLHRLQQPPSSDNGLDRFRAAFAERFEEREVPLAEALDEDTGVGHALNRSGRSPSPLLQDLDFPEPSRQTIEWGSREQWLLDRVGRALAAGTQEIALTPADIEVLETAAPAPLPDAFAAMATVVGGQGPDGSGHRVLLQLVTGPSGARLLGRFCHGDATLHARVLEHLRAEEALDPDAVYAEIVHLPEGRTGNILLRPLMREYEIAYLGRSGAPSHQHLSLDDLTLALVDGRFVLRSRRLGRRVVPRLTSAHDYERGSVGVYRLLCLLQAEGRTEACTWQWGPLRSLPFLPRISAGTLVLSLATWHVTKADIAAMRGTDMAARFTSVQRWRASRALPRWVVLADADNTLPVDLDNVLAVESFVQLMTTRDEATLTELFPGPDQLCARGPDGAYTHEVIVPFLSSTPPRAATTSAVSSTHAVSGPSNRGDVARVFPPGTSWVFAKLYAGAGVGDRLLTSVVAPVSRELLDEGAIERWFFLRYADPDEHLRWRLQVPHAVGADEVRRRIETAVRPLVENGLVRRLTFDTYEREIERYGGSGAIALAEQWFWADSEAIVDVVEQVTQDDGGEELRWRVGILGVDALLADLGLDLTSRCAVMRSARGAFGREFRVNAAFRKQLAGKFRAVRGELAAALEHGVAQESPLGAALAPLEARSERSLDAMTRLRHLEDLGLLERSRTVLAESYVHMFLNRLFRSDQRMHELVIYDVLAQLYAERLARVERSAGRS